MRLLTILWSAILSTTVSIPMENTEKGTLPSVESANAGAQKLLHALNSGDPSVAKDFFFPKDAFNLVKDLPKPERYHKKLMRWYEEDILKEHKRFRKGTWRFKELKLGWCKWKEKGTEGNKLPYWSCRGNFVSATNGEKSRRFEIRVLINWGNNWYVTHLGPIRK